MTELDYAHFNRLLQQEKAALLQDVGEKGMRQRVSLKDSTGELSLVDNHPADTGSELFERSKDLALHADRLKTLDEINRALERLTRGVYGRCTVCGQAIARERLEALPYAACCLHCQARQEERSREGGADRPVEESLLSPPFLRTFNDGRDYTGFDGEDAWQKVARYGTSSTPQDVPGSVDNPAFIESGAESGRVDHMDALPSRREIKRKKEQGEGENARGRES